MVEWPWNFFFSRLEQIINLMAVLDFPAAVKQQKCNFYSINKNC
jgi:hypothetical protein